ncbi:MAG: hypothetical protein METHAR1v1_1290005 [Methanothrix sp.]|nr:MAG: hypothetical protein METHAR1v1_1290005 [Methanothrix sp.]
MYLSHCWVTQGTCISYHINYVILCALPTSLNNSIVPFIMHIVQNAQKKKDIIIKKGRGEGRKTPVFRPGM